MARSSLSFAERAAIALVRTNQVSSPSGVKALATMAHDMADAMTQEAQKRGKAGLSLAALQTRDFMALEEARSLLQTIADGSVGSSPEEALSYAVRHAQSWCHVNGSGQ